MAAKSKGSKRKSGGKAASKRAARLVVENSPPVFVENLPLDPGVRRSAPAGDRFVVKATGVYDLAFPPGTFLKREPEPKPRSAWQRFRDFFRGRP